MDNKRLLIGMSLVMALVFGWMTFVNYLYKKNQWQMPEAKPAAATQPVAQGQAAPVSPALRGASGQPSISAGSSLRAVGVASGATVTLGSAEANDKKFAMALTVSTQGAGLEEVVLNSFTQKVGSNARYAYQQPLGPDSIRSLATREVVINGKTVDLSQVNWRLEQQSPDSATMAVEVAGPDGPVATVRKTFSVPDRDLPTMGYEIQVRTSVENHTSQPLTVRTTFNGTNEPPRELDNGPDRQVIGGYSDDELIQLAGHPLESFDKDKSVQNLTKNDKGFPVVWAGMSSVYFDAIVFPEPLEKSKATAGYIGKVTAEAINPGSELKDRAVAMNFQTTDLTVSPGTGKALSIPLSVYLGPKWRKVLNTPYYSDFPRSYEKTLVTSGGCCGFMTFQPLINLLVSLLTAFHWVLHDWGLAIITLVILVRLILHPITKRSTISMQKMGKMGPEMERLKKKYGDNKDELNKAMMQFYKEQGVTPILGCLPLFLQMPIWIALWQALQGTFELRQAPFLWGYTWIHDLAKPDALIKFSQPIPLIFGWTLASINVLPVLMAGVTYLQQKFQPKPVAATPEQEQQQKMMQWMSMIIPLMFYSMPSGLNLYYVTSMGLGILESKRIRDHLKAQEEAEKAGRVLVDAKPTRRGKMLKDEAHPAKKPGGLMGWLASLQERAEQIRREQEKKGK